MSRFRIPFLLIGVIALIVGLAACGGSGDWA